MIKAPLVRGPWTQLRGGKLQGTYGAIIDEILMWLVHTENMIRKFQCSNRERKAQTPRRFKVFLVSNLNAAPLEVKLPHTS